jgi:hypothetical protein
MDLSQLSELTAQLVRAEAAPGVSVALSIDGRRAAVATGVAHTGTGTPLNSESRFQLGCITKLLTSIVALELWQQGSIDLNAPIGTSLSELSQTTAGRTVTPRHLLSHTSGYRGLNIADPAVRYYYSWSKLIELLNSNDRLFEPGMVFNYEHTECVLLGEIVQRATGENILDLFRAMIFDPLSIRCGTVKSDLANQQYCLMDHSYDPAAQRFQPMRTPPHSKFWDASLSDLTMSLSDLVVFGEAVAGFSDSKCISSHTRRMIFEPVIRLPESIGTSQLEVMPIGFGNGCAQYGSTIFGHNGSARGQTCALRFDLNSRLVLATGINCWNPQLRDMLCAKILANVSSDPVKTPVRNVPAWMWADVSGRYIGSTGTYIDVSRRGQSLVCALHHGAFPKSLEIVLTPTADGGVDVHSDAPHLTIGFFAAPPAGEAAVVLALNSYRRTSEGATIASAPST